MSEDAFPAPTPTPERARPHILANWPMRPNRWMLGGLVFLLVALVVPVGVWAASNHPDGEPPRGSEAESRVAVVFGQPSGSDDTVVGDLMIERFYAVDAETGQRMIGDVVKGRIKQIQTWSRDSHGAAGYYAMVDRSDLSAQKTVLTNYIRELVPPDPSVTYLGAAVLPGARDGMQINYDGTMPLQHEPFKAPRNWPLFDWLAYVKFTDASGPFFWPNRGYNYLLNNTEAWPPFKALFNTNKAVFVSELIVVDMTTQAHRELYYKMLNDAPDASPTAVAASSVPTSVPPTATVAPPPATPTSVPAPAPVAPAATATPVRVAPTAAPPVSAPPVSAPASQPAPPTPLPPPPAPPTSTPLPRPPAAPPGR